MLKHTATRREATKYRFAALRFCSYFLFLTPRSGCFVASAPCSRVLQHTVLFTSVILTRYKYPALAALACIVIVGLLFFAHTLHKPEAPATLDGKWVGTVVWNDASGRPYQQKLKTALFFLPHHVCGIVITFPTGAIGGKGTYTRQGNHVSVTGVSLSINGRPLPPDTFTHQPWYRATAGYTAAYDSEHLTLTPDKEPAPAPCWPLLVSPAPITLGRIAPPDEPAATPAPGE